ncbi:MAG: transcription elongation factor GreA [Thermoleophilia bacterium]
MMDREVILTEEGHAKLKEEIEYLSTVKRREVAERIKEAREFGDISENSEYDDAKNEQAQVEYRIQQLEQKLRNARVVDTEHLPKDTVSIGTLVTLRDPATKKTREYSIVGSAEADPRHHRLSNESPVGKALLGRKKGETVVIPAPRGSLEYKIVKISRAPHSEG